MREQNHYYLEVIEFMQLTSTGSLYVVLSFVSSLVCSKGTPFPWCGVFWELFRTWPQGEKVYIFPCPKSAAERNGGTNAHESCPRMSPERAEPKKRSQSKWNGVGWSKSPFNVVMLSKTEYWQNSTSFGNQDWCLEEFCLRQSGLQMMQMLRVVESWKLMHHLSTLVEWMSLPVSCYLLVAGGQCGLMWMQPKQEVVPTQPIFEFRIVLTNEPLAFHSELDSPAWSVVGSLPLSPFALRETAHMSRN